LGQNTDSPRPELAAEIGFAFGYRPPASSRSDRKLGSSEVVVCRHNQAKAVSSTAVGASAVVVVRIIEAVEL
jgi:hypothetical protein